MTVRIYLRRSKNDEGKQQYSVDVQRNGCIKFAEERGLATRDEIVEYLDDGKAGDDFHTRTGIRRLVADVQKDDVIVCRDQSRLGRDALEVTLVIRDLIRDHGCQLFYYTTGQEVQFQNAIDQVTTFIQGTGHQMELEAIRSRTREALRSRVRKGQIAGGKCYGYMLERRRDESGRRYTVALVDEDQAEVVRRIYDDYVIGRGLKWIACRLNEEGVPSPTVGRRGSGSWAPSAIRAMLRNPRYRGVYVHGKIKKVRIGGKVKRVEADPSEIITIDVPEWRIVDDETWFAVHEIFESRPKGKGRAQRTSKKGGAATRYPLSGIGRCGVCGGSIGSAGRWWRRNKQVTAYACITHHNRGNAVCPVKVYQPHTEVDASLLTHLREHVITPEVVESVLERVRVEIARQFEEREIDTSALRTELKQARAEQKRLARAIAVVEDAPELLSELQKRRVRIRHIETQLAKAERTPEERATDMAAIESTVRDWIQRLDQIMLDDRNGLRALFSSLFPDGLIFTPMERQKRRVWAISGAAHLGAFNSNGDPNGI